MAKDSVPSYLKWYWLLIYVAAPMIVLLALATDVFKTKQPGEMPQAVWILGGLLLLIAMIVLVAKTISVGQMLEDNGHKLDRINEAQEKNRAVLDQILQSEQLSESAKTIAYREAEIRCLREVVFNKLQQQDFEAAYEIIAELDSKPAYLDLAAQLRKQAEKFQSSTDQERGGQLIANIDKLLEENQWAKASVQIEQLLQAFPDSEAAKKMPQKLLDKKEERKKKLLGAWDEAVKRQATDRSLQILRELDQYLTPNEGLALQEAARDAFRSKLHNLGVNFSIAVSGKQWGKAFETGQQIVREFPNSKMAQEIHERLNVLKERALETGK